MREIKNEIAMVHPNAIFLTSCSNAGKLTYDSIEILGQWLANELKDFMNEEKDQDQEITSITWISFIGHSLGGVIIRAALPRLEQYKHLFFSYASLSSPHLGYTFHKSALITTGMWML